MGTWGVKIFQSDDAQDVKAVYAEKLAVGLSDEAAEEAVIREFDAYPDAMWLPLAMEQWKKGRLSERVKTNALRTIEEELTVLDELWKKELVSKRRDELIKASKKICTEMPERKKVRMPSWALRSPFQPGNVVQYKLLYLDGDLEKWCGKYVLLEVVGITQTPPDKIPCEVISLRPYRWYGDHAVSDVDSITTESIETMSFYYGNGVYRESISLMPMKEDVKQHEIVCVCKTPLDSGVVRNTGAGLPDNPTISKQLAITLEHHFCT